MHKPEFQAKVALTAIKGDLTMAEMVKKFDVQAVQITQWKKQLLASAGAVFDQGNQLADDHEQEILELRAKVEQLVLENDFLEARARTDSRAQRKEMVSKREVLSMTRQWELLELARSTYDYVAEPVSDEQLELMKLIDPCYIDKPFYGTRRVRDWLWDNHGRVVNRKRIQRLRCLMALETVYPKPDLSNADQQHRIHLYLLNNVKVTRPNQVWCTDITYIPMSKGFVDLAAVMDGYSPRVLSWRLSTTMDTDFCVDALEEAIENDGTPEIVNTDQGAQFTREEFTGVLKHHDIKISMDGKGRCMDHVIVERLWRSLKYEEVYLCAYDTVEQAGKTVGCYFECYHSERRHPWLGRLTPEERYRLPQTAAREAA